jgi:predicted ABC-type ATPase
MLNLYVIGGCNGAGKTTIATKLLPHYLNCYEFVNADSIAAGLSPFRPESVALRAGRLMLERLQTLADASVDFGFESTLASRTFAPFLHEQKAKGYSVQLLYVSLRSPDLAVQRVAQRVLAGGHDIPEATIRRRYQASRHNLINLYLPLADEWRVVDNTTNVVLVAEGGMNLETAIYQPQIWEALK